MDYTVNNDLLENALKVTGLSTPEDVITFALNELIRKENAKELLKLKGKIDWQGNISEMRQNRYQHDFS